MKYLKKDGPEKSKLKRYVWIIAFAWTLIIIMSLIWTLFDLRRDILESAYNYAISAYEKDMIYREWNSKHGGVYVPVAKDNPPNPFLAHIPERDITTPSGKRLTLMNPAYVIRQVHEMLEEKQGVRGHITSLDPISDENIPDPWETEALKTFEDGEVEVTAIEKLNGEEYLRLIRPMKLEKDCFKCHGNEGYFEGDIRGGISVSIPMKPLWASATRRMLALSFGHFFLLIIGLAGIFTGGTKIIKSDKERRQAEETLRIAHSELEDRVKDRTKELAKVNQELTAEINERKQVAEQLGRQTTLSMAINTVLRETISCETEEELGKTCLSVSENMTGSKFGFIGELNTKGLMDTIAISNPGWDACEIAVSDASKHIKSMPIRGIYRSTIKDGKSRIVNEDEMETHPDWLGPPEGHPKITAFLGVPLKRDGKTIGIIGLGNKESGYTIHDQQAVEDLSVAIIDSLMRKRTEIMLKESETKLRDVVDQSNDGIYVIKDNRFAFINPRFTTITGFSLEDISDENFNYKQIVAKEGLKVLKEREETRRQGKEPPSRYEFKGLHKSGTEIDLETNVTEIDWEGSPAVLGVVRDVTKRVQARKALEDALDEAKRANRLKSHFISNMSHEIRTPLNSILGFTEIIKEKVIHLVDKDEKTFCETIQTSCARLLRTMGEIMDISLIDSGTYHFKHQPVDLVNLTAEVVKELGPKANERQLKLAYSSELADAIIYADDNSVKQSLIHLIDNAINYTQKGRIDIVLKKEGEEISLYIKDTGIGMAEEYQQQLYEPYSQESSGFSKNYQGIGLGLALTKRYLDMNKIGINVESATAKGTTVKLTCGTLLKKDSVIS